MRITKILFLAFSLITSLISNAQSFSFQLLNDSVSYGYPGGNDIVVEGNIINQGPSDLQIDIIRKENNLPPNWQSYMCADVCLAPFADSTRLYLPAGTTQLFKFSFISSNGIDTANSLIKFKNVANGSNTINSRMYGVTSLTASISSLKNDMQLSIFPNPVMDKLMVKSNFKILNIRCIDVLGKIVPLEFNPIQDLFLDVSSLSTGCYFIYFHLENGTSINRIFIKK